MGRILIASENEKAVGVIRRLLENDGHWVLAMGAHAGLLNRLLSHRPDVVLVDENAENENLPDFVTQIRKSSVRSQLPVLILTSNSDPLARQSLLEKTQAVGIIATDSIDESGLSSTIRTLLERTPFRKGSKRFLRFGHLELDRDHRSARLGVAMVSNLPLRLFDLLWFLAKRAMEEKEIATRKIINTKLWKSRVRDREVDVIVSRLKSRVPFIGDYLQSIPGKGYRFTLPSLSPTPASKPRKALKK